MLDTIIPVACLSVIAVRFVSFCWSKSARVLDNVSEPDDLDGLFEGEAEIDWESANDLYAANAAKLQAVVWEEDDEEEISEVQAESEVALLQQWIDEFAPVERVTDSDCPNLDVLTGVSVWVPEVREVPEVEVTDTSWYGQLSRMTTTQLRKLAKGTVKRYSKMSKNELIAALA